jgi:nicotinamidase-related amidase
MNIPTMSPLIISPASAMLLHIDLQQRLLPAIAGGDEAVANAVWLTRIARQLGVPIGATVQYPQGLGPTCAALAELLTVEESVEKTHFSAVREGCLGALNGFDRRQMVLTGCETHVCVLQTALDLQQSGKQVFVVADAVGSRLASDKALALERMRSAGVVIVSREMVAFEWLQRAGTEVFRAINRQFIR